MADELKFVWMERFTFFRLKCTWGAGICRHTLHRMGLYWKQPDHNNKRDMTGHPLEGTKKKLLKGYMSVDYAVMALTFQ